MDIFMFLNRYSVFVYIYVFALICRSWIYLYTLIHKFAMNISIYPLILQSWWCHFHFLHGQSRSKIQDTGISHLRKKGESDLFHCKDSFLERTINATGPTRSNVFHPHQSALSDQAQTAAILAAVPLNPSLILNAHRTLTVIIHQPRIQHQSIT